MLITLQRLAKRALGILVPFFVSVLAGAASLRGQSGGVVTGRVWAERPGEAVPFVLIALAGADDGVRRRSVLSDSSGTYRFGGVEPGRYRLFMDRIGFERQTSPVLRVGEGDTAAYDFTGRPQAVTIGPVVANVGCYTVDRLGQDSALAAVWNETRKGVDTRRAFDRQYAYAFDLRQRTVLWPVRGAIPQRDTARESYVNVPELADQVAELRRLMRRQRGYGFSEGKVLRLELPDEAELLDDDFMREHCLETGLEVVDGAWEVSFRPVRKHGNIDVRGTIRLDTATFQVRSVSYEYVRGNRSFIRATVQYGDVEFPGGTLRLAVSGEFEGRPVGRVGYTVRRVNGTVAFVNFRTAAPASPPAP
jgi:hypothetical protein